MQSRSLVIIGDSFFAQVEYPYFNSDTNYKVAGFSVERQFLRNEEMFNLPVVAFDKLAEIFPPEQHSVFVAITYGQLNRLRARLLASVKNIGYELASYISPLAYVSQQACLGKHCFVFENNVIQPFSEIGENVILWSGNHIGHHSKIDNHCFISSHVVVSGNVSVGKHCFLGVNSTIVNDVSLGDDCWIGPGVVINKDVQSGSLFPPVDFMPSPVSTYKFFKVGESLGQNIKV